MTVYLDEVFAVNLIMDWLILWLAGNLAQCGAGRWRLRAAALLGAVYSVAVFFPWGVWLTLLPIKIGWSLLMLVVAYSFVNWRNYLKLVIYFYFVSFVLGGASVAAMYLFGEQSIQTWSGVALVEIDFQLFWLVIAAGMVSAAVWYLRNRLRQDLSAPQQIVTGWVQLGEQVISLQLLVDSGHSLTDPLSGKSVVVAEQRILLPLFSEAVQKILGQQLENGADILLLMAEQSNMAGRWRLIPFQTVGQQGLLLGFRPDSMILQYGTVKRTCHNIIVAMSSQQFSSHETYQGLVPPDLL